VDGEKLRKDWQGLILMIPYRRQDISESDIQAVVNLLRLDFLTQGPAVPAFEKVITGCRGITKRQEIQAQHPGVDWLVAMMPGKRLAFKKSKTVDALVDKLEKIKAGIRAKVEHPFRVIKCQFGYRKTWYRELISFNLAEMYSIHGQLRLAGQEALNAKHSQPPSLQLIKVALRA
jgi:hypothetical protein